MTAPQLLVYAFHMTPYQATKTLLEAGYYSEWHGRVLVGGLKKDYSTKLTYKEVESELVRFELYLVDTSTIELVFKTSDLELFPEGLRSQFTVGEPSPDRLIPLKAESRFWDLGRAVEAVISTLSVIQNGANYRLDTYDRRDVDPKMLFELGQAFPHVGSEVDALSHIWERPKVVRDGVEYPLPLVVTSSPTTIEDRLEYPLTDYVHTPLVIPDFMKEESQTVSIKSFQELEADRVGPIRPASVKNYSDVFWYPIDRLPDPEFRRFRNRDGAVVKHPKPKTVKVEFIASLLAHTHKDGLDVLLFTSREPVDGVADAIVLYTKSEPPVGESQPEWLEKVLNYGPSGGGRRTQPEVIRVNEYLTKFIHEHLTNPASPPTGEKEDDEPSTP